MKNIFLGIAAFALLIVAGGCNNETVEKPKSDSQITFHSTLGKQTRASEFVYWADGAGFTVKSYISGTTTSFGDFTLVYDDDADGSWSYTENDGAIEQPGYGLTYYAWYPDGTGSLAEFSIESLPATLAYEVAGTAEDQEDLIAAWVNTGDANVTLTFSHLLSQVNFAVQEVENVKITLSNIKINSVLTKGTYTFGTGWGTSANTVLENPYEYEAIDDAFPTTGTLDEPIVYLGNKGGNTQSDNNNGNALMLMPQTFEEASDGTITFDYVLTDMGDTPTTIGSGSATANLCDFAVTTWAAGKRYLYLIDFTNYFKTGVINFTVEMTTWTDDDEYMIATTLEVAKANKHSIEGAIGTHNANKTEDLLVFPISLPRSTELEADIVLDLTEANSGNFVAGDVIKIQCYDAANIDFIKLKAGVEDYWTLGISGTTVVTLTRTEEVWP